MTWADIFPNSCRFWWELERHQHLLAHLGFHMVPCYSIFHWIQANTDFAKSGSHSILEKPASCQLYCVPNRWRNVSNVHQKWSKHLCMNSLWYIYIYIFFFWTTSKWRLSPLSSIIHFSKTPSTPLSLISHSRNAAQGRGVQCTRTALDFQKGNAGNKKPIGKKMGNWGFERHANKCRHIGGVIFLLDFFMMPHASQELFTQIRRHICWHPWRVATATGHPTTNLGQHSIIRQVAVMDNNFASWK